MTTPAQTEQSPQEIIQGLERTFIEKQEALQNAKDTLARQQDAVMVAQEAAFRAYNIFVMNKERYANAVINNIQSQAQTISKQLEESKAAELKAKQDLENLRKQLGFASKATVEVLPDRRDNVSA